MKPNCRKVTTTLYAVAALAATLMGAILLLEWTVRVAAAIVIHSSISHLTVKATFKVRKTKSSRDGVPLSGERAL